MQQGQFYSISFFRWSFLSLLLSALLLLALHQHGGVDMALARYYFDPVTTSFPLKHHWVTDQLMHVYLKWVLVLFGFFWIGLALITLLAPNALGWSALTIFRIRFVAVAAVFIPLTISTLKQFSPVHCPWNLALFGGQFPHIPLLQSFVSDLPAGHCAPAGHAASGLWLASLAVFWLPNSPSLARRALFAGVSVGLVLGWGQEMRGAHFLSHTLWSVWLTLFLLFTMWSLSHNAFYKHYLKG